MKREIWICIVLATALVLAVYCTPAKAAENYQEAGLRAAERLFEMKMYEQAKKVLLEMKPADLANPKATALLAKVNSEIKKSGIVKAKPVNESDLDKVIRKVEFTDAHFEEVVGYLSTKCNVNIVISEQAARLLKTGMPAFNEKNAGDDVITVADDGFEPPFPGEEAKPESKDIGGITIRLKDVPLKAVLKYILQMKGLSYRVEDYAIVIVPQGYVPDEEMETRIFRIHSGASGLSGQSVTGY